MAARLVSILATVGCWWMIFALVRRETGSVWGGMAAGGFYAATFKATGVWMDVARSDSLLVFFLLLAAFTARDERAGCDLSLIRSYPGEVFIPAHSYYAALVGKPTYVHWATITDTSGIWDTDLDVQQGGKNDPRRQIILDEIQAAVASQRFDAIILDDIPKELKAYWGDLLTPYYRLERKVFAEPDVFWTVSGAGNRPQLVYIRR